MLTKTGIEYLDFAWNFYPGCNHWQTGICPVGERCWAKGMSQRFKGGDFEPHLLPEKLLDPLKGKQGGRRIGVCFTGDLFGDWVDPEQKIGKQVEMWKLIEHRGWIAKPDNPLKRIVFEVIKLCHQDTFIFLTKNPARLANWSPFPDNCWVGVSACNWLQFSNALGYLMSIEAKVKFISFEPLMQEIKLDMMQKMLFPQVINWVIIGGWDRGKTQPKVEWIRGIIEAADRTGIPVFLKDNLTGKCNKAGLPVDGLLERHNAPWAFKDMGDKGSCFRREFPKEAN